MDSHGVTRVSWTNCANLSQHSKQIIAAMEEPSANATKHQLAEIRFNTIYCY